MRVQYQYARIAAKAADAEMAVARGPDLGSAWICWIRSPMALPALVLLTRAPLELAMSVSQTEPRD